MDAPANDSHNPDDIIRIMVATDIHLGHVENDPIRGEDSFVAFEEVLSLAVEYDVDFILLGGDLFDHAKPSPSCMLQCTRLIREYCFGDKPVAVELLSDQLENFARNINYEDPNLNVSYPILSIHGNHDDPVGQNSVSSLDILSSMGLVNYFGKWNDYTHVQVAPVLLRKGATNLALYGLSHLKDQRLSRLFKDNKVEMNCLPDNNDWFNLLVLHQNRADRGAYNYIPESCLPEFLDLVVWGHEHDCRVTEEYNGNFYVTQPGSTVATSLAAGEALPKHCALLQIHQKTFTIQPIPLQTVRPFIFQTIVLSEENLDDAVVNQAEKVQEFLMKKVYEAVDKARDLRSGHPRQPMLPLVRLSVFYEHEDQNFNRVRFGQNLNGVVANPNDILIMKREKRLQDRKNDPSKLESEALEAAVSASGDVLDVAALLEAYYDAQPPESRLGLLSARAMADAVRDFTTKNNDETFRKVFEAHKRHCIDRLMKTTAETEDEVAEYLLEFKQQLDSLDGGELKTMMNTVPRRELKVEVTRCRTIAASDDELEVREVSERGKGRGTRARGRGRRGGRVVVEPSPPPPPPVTERRTPRRAAAQKSASWLESVTSSRSPRKSSRFRADSPIDIDDSD